MITRADKNDIPAMTALWQECFGDDEKLISAFFGSPLYDGILPLVCRQGGKIVSQLFLIDSVYRGEKPYPSYYLYAACTSPAFRGRGIMSRLIEASVRAAKENGRDFICLLPGEEGLYRYYEKLGFEACCRAERISAESGKEIPGDILSAPRFFSRDCADLAVTLCEAGGYTAFRHSQYGCAVFEKDGGTLDVTDIEITPDTGKYIDFLLKETGCDRARVLLPAPGDEGEKHGMVYRCSDALPGEGVFLNFTLD